MCDKHDFIDDDLTDIFGDLPAAPVSDEDASFVKDHLAKAKHEVKTGDAVFEEPCPKCKGSGSFVGYTGRVVGRCFNCKGTGKVTFKTSPETRAKQAEQRQAAKDRKQKELAEKAAHWLDSHKDEAQWMAAAGARGFDFAKSMLEAVMKWGTLTEKQLAAVRRCMAQDLEREREQQEAAERAPDIDTAALGKIHDAFSAALAKDIKYPKLRLDAYLFSLVRSGQNAGAIYVKTIAKGDDGERTYLGKIVEGRFFRAFKCTDEDEQRIVAAATDPAAAAIAYGRREGACSICGRKLTNHTSIDRGIGPICADNFGF